MNFDRPPIAPVTPEKEKPKNRLGVLLVNNVTFLENRLAGIPKSLPETARAKRALEISNYFRLLGQLRERCEAEWVSQNRARLGEQLTDAQVAEMHKYTDSVGKEKLDTMLESWIADYESLLETEKDESEKQELIALIDAAHILQADMANW